MKSKLTRMKPEELGNMKFKDAKMIVKKDLSILQGLGVEGSSFFVSTEFDFLDKKKAPLFVVGELKGDWKKYAKDNVKPPHKTTAAGTCILSEDGTTLTLNIEKGKAKPKAIDKALTKGALSVIPSTVTNVVFNETPKLDADDDINAVDDDDEVVSSASADEEFKKVVAEAKLYKSIKADDFTARLDKIKEIDALIVAWEKKNMPVKGDETKEARNATLQKLRGQLYGHRIDINVKNRKGAEPISAIEKAWEAYKKRPEVQGTEALADVEDRVDTVSDLKETIQGWYNRNQAPYSPAEDEVKKALDKIALEVNSEDQRLSLALPTARKAHVKALVDQLMKASPEEKEKLKKDEMFLWELSRVIPVAQINDANKLLGLPPVKEQKEGDTPLEQKELDMWKDPEIQELFKDFCKFTTFEVAVDHKDNPGIAKKVLLVAGTQIWEEGKTSADKWPTSEDYTLELISEDASGNMRLKSGDSYFYAVRTDKTIEAAFKVLPADTKLFPEPPSKTHVQQGGLGDCYLLAALASLAAKDSSAIEAMMLDKGDTVTVRLFDVKVDAVSKKKTFKAKYINVDKSIPKVGTADMTANKYLWVQLLEKAYAAGNFTGTFTDYQNNTNAGGEYAKIDSGWPAFAMEVLTGKPGELLFYHTGSPKDFAITGIPPEERGKNTGSQGFTYEHLPWSTHELGIYKTPNTDYKAAVAYKIFGNKTVDVVKWATYVKKGPIDKLFAREYVGDYSGEPTLEDFELLFQGKMKDANDDDVAGLPKLDAGLATTMLNWIKGKSLYPGKRGSGVYSVLQLSLFKDIKDALTAGKLVCLGSKLEVGRKQEGTGHSGGEAISGGLVGRHAFSVLETREVDPLKEMEIRNPWGNTVQRNVKVSDRMLELEKVMKDLVAKVVDPIKKELSELKGLIDDIKIKFENEKDKNKKRILKEQFDIWATKYKALIAKRDQYSNLASLKGKMGADTASFDKALAEWTGLKKKDPSEMISTQEDNLEGQEGGEFWLYLDDLTRRFSNVNIG